MWSGQGWLWKRDNDSATHGSWKKAKLLTHDSLTTDKDSHFTGALTQGSKEDENITGLLADKIRINSIAIMADQRLDLFLYFWNQDDFDNADLDLDDFSGIIHCDLVTHGVQIGSGKWYLSLEDLCLDYEDEDSSKELHLSLYNASPAAKNAGASGEVVVQIKYELRE